MRACFLDLPKWLTDHIVFDKDSCLNINELTKIITQNGQLNTDYHLVKRFLGNLPKGRVRRIRRTDIYLGIKLQVNKDIHSAITESDRNYLKANAIDESPCDELADIKERVKDAEVQDDTAASNSHKHEPTSPMKIHKEAHLKSELWQQVSNKVVPIEGHKDQKDSFESDVVDCAFNLCENSMTMEELEEPSSPNIINVAHSAITDGEHPNFDKSNAIDKRSSLLSAVSSVEIIKTTNKDEVFANDAFFNEPNSADTVFENELDDTSFFEPTELDGVLNQTENSDLAFLSDDVDQNQIDGSLVENLAIQPAKMSSFRIIESENPQYFDGIIFDKFRESRNNLRPAHFGYSTFQKFIEEKLPFSARFSESQIIIHKLSTNLSGSILRYSTPFLCGAFKPVCVKNSEVTFSAFGDMLPQFHAKSLNNNVEFLCNICPEFLKVSSSTRRNCANLRGTRQLYEHSIQKTHKNAIKWLSENTISETGLVCDLNQSKCGLSDTEISLPLAKHQSQRSIATFFETCQPAKKIPCLHL